MAKKICLDAGHYGKYNRSPVVPAFYESDFNWKFHLLLKKYLEQYEDVEVITTRIDQDTDMDLYQRGRCAEGCDLFLSVHANWAARESADYPVAYVPINGSGDIIGRKLAQCVAAVMETDEGAMVQNRQSERGLWDWYGVIYGAVEVGAVGIILEHSFYTNSRSVRWLMEDENLKKLAKAEAEVIAQHYGLKKAVAADDQWYRIRRSWEDAGSQVGAYKSLEAAVDNCPAGYRVYDWEGDVVYLEDPPYTHKQFVMDIQKAVGVAVDGVAGQETLRSTPSISADRNSRHPVVKPLQKCLYEMGYVEVGGDDGIAGAKFASAIAHFQMENDCAVTGKLTEWDKTWHMLLGMG